MSNFLATPPIEKARKRPNGKQEYRNTAAIILKRDDATIRRIEPGWRSDGGSFPEWANWLPVALPPVSAMSFFMFDIAPQSIGLAVAAILVSLWMISLPSRLIWAYFMHDEACQQYLDFPKKADADRLFNEAMKALGISIIHRLPIYTYVRMRSQRTQWQQPERTPIWAWDAYNQSEGSNTIVGWK